MKSQLLQAGKVYGVIPSWDYSSAEKKDPNKVRRGEVIKAELLNLTKYDYDVYRSVDLNDPHFKSAPANSRVVGYLFKGEFRNETVYWVSRPQNIVAEYEWLEQRWEETEKQEKEERERQEREREIRVKKREEAQQRAERSIYTIKQALVSLLGSERAQKVNSNIGTVIVDSEYVPVAQFTFDDRTLNVLIEKVLEAEELV